jgi:hypothetical protein
MQPESSDSVEYFLAPESRAQPAGPVPSTSRISLSLALWRRTRQGETLASAECQVERLRTTVIQQDLGKIAFDLDGVGVATERVVACSSLDPNGPARADPALPEPGQAHVGRTHRTLRPGA